MTVFLVRHADAKSRSGWDGPDHLRPLTKKGRRQAAGLLDYFGQAPIDRILSSPAVRCVETVVPLGDERGVPVEAHDDLMEGAATDAALDVLHGHLGKKGDLVLCTHGDLVPELLRALCKDGLTLMDDLRFAKGSTWVLTGKGRQLTEARYYPPPGD